MPDFSGHGLLTVCDGVHHQTPAGDSHSHEGACPFSIGAIYEFSGIEAPVIIPPVYAVAIDVPFFASPFEQNIYFSNTSPRSPPFFS